MLHSIFEELYGFDLEDKRKKNQGPTVKWLEKMDGTTRFVVAYVVQAALDGHSIPVDAGTMGVLRVLDLVTAKEAATGEVPGMERAIGKSKGVEFGSLLHQLGADYLSNPFSLQVREIILAIDPEAAKRFPQRRQTRSEAATAAESTDTAAPPAAPPRKKKTESAAVAEAKASPGDVANGEAAKTETVKAETAARGTAETKPAEGKKAAAATKKTAEPPPPSAEKAHDKPAKAERSEKTEKHTKAEKPHKTEKLEVSRTSPPSDGLGKRKPR